MGNRAFIAQIALFSKASLLSIFAILVLPSWFATNAIAGATSPAPTTPVPQSSSDPTYMPWNNQSVYEACDQTCLLQKGNENLSMQALYLVNRMNTIQGLYQDKKYSDLQSELQGFCPDFKDATSKDQADSCFYRYLRTQTGTLRQMKQAIATNQNSMIGYRSDVASVNPNGTITRKAVPVDVVEPTGTGANRLPQTSYATDMRTQAEVQAAYNLESKKLNALTNQKYQDWLASLPPKPSKEDFYQWKSVPLDPSDPSAGHVSVLLRDATGAPVIDQKGFDAAKREYDSQVKSYSGLDSAPTQPMAASTRAVADYISAHDEFMGTAKQPVQQGQQAVQSANQLTLSFSPKVKTRAPAAGPPPGQSVYTTFRPDDLEQKIEMYEKALPECQSGPCGHDDPPK